MQTTRAIRVSYLITTRNRCEYLERTLDNVREFITADDELIVIDGGSSDRTVQILEANRDLISLFLSEPDKSEAHAFNKGWRRARGKYIKPISDDDYFCPTAMKRMAELMESHPELDALQCGGEQWRVTDGKKVFTAYRFLPDDLPSSAELIHRHAHIGLGLIIRTSTLERIGGPAGHYRSVDGDISVRLIECNCTIGYLDVNGYRWFVYPHSGSNNSARFEYEYLLMDIRQGNWHRLFFYNPIRLLKLPLMQRVPPSLRALWLVCYTGNLLGLKLNRAYRRVLRAANLMRPKSKSASQHRNWTGQLR